MVYNVSLIAVFYTDPGSGFLILQLISSAIVGGGFFFRKRLAAFLRWFHRDKQA